MRMLTLYGWTEGDMFTLSVPVRVSQRVGEKLVRATGGAGGGNVFKLEKNDLQIFVFSCMNRFRSQSCAHVQNYWTNHT